MKSKSIRAMIILMAFVVTSCNNNSSEKEKNLEQKADTTTLSQETTVKRPYLKELEKVYEKADKQILWEDFDENVMVYDSLRNGPCQLRGTTEYVAYNTEALLDYLQNLKDNEYKTVYVYFGKHLDSEFCKHPIPRRTSIAEHRRGKITVMFSPIVKVKNVEAKNTDPQPFDVGDPHP